jgi:hypothetical protein
VKTGVITFNKIYERGACAAIISGDRVWNATFFSRLITWKDDYTPGGAHPFFLLQKGAEQPGNTCPQYGSNAHPSPPAHRPE